MNVIPFPPRDHRDDHGSESSHTGSPDTSATAARAVWTVKETAHMLSLSLGSTYALIRSGEIPAIKVGGRWLIPKNRLQQWLDNLPVASVEDIERELNQLGL